MSDPTRILVASATAEDNTRSELIIKANQAMYKQNVELAIRNKTLGILRNISEITMRAIGPTEVSQAIVDMIAKEMNLAVAIISLVDSKTQVLRIAGLTRDDAVEKALTMFTRPLDELVIPLSEDENLAVHAIRDREQKLTENLLDLFVPLTNQETADEIGKVTGVKSIMIYPLLLGEKALGILTLGLAKHVDDLSRAEKETLHELIDVVTIAIDRAELIESLQSTRDHLQEANTQLEMLDKLKDEFVSLASHELRTPLTAIRSYVWMAVSGKGGEVTEKQKYYLDRAFTSTERLIKLVNDMLNISRIESGRMAVQLKKVNITSLVHRMIEEIQPKITELSLTVDISGDDEVPDVIADPDKIQEVLINFVGNAMKFTPTGGRICIVIAHVSPYVCVSVTDTGIGIAITNLNKLFTKFGAIRANATPEAIAAQSTGLGLYISKSIIAIHGGTVAALSEGIGKGSTFSFTLPVYSPEKMTEMQKHHSNQGLGIIHRAIV